MGESLAAKPDGNWRISTRIEAAIRPQFVVFLHCNGVLPAQQPDQLGFLLAACFQWLPYSNFRYLYSTQSGVVCPPNAGAKHRVLRSDRHRGQTRDSNPNVAGKLRLH
jgi:hypothetical protein